MPGREEIYLPDEKHETNYRNNLEFRVNSLEQVTRDHRKFLDELRLAKAMHEEQIGTLKDQHKQADIAINKINDSKEGMLAILNERMSRIEDTLTHNLNALADKFEKDLGGLTDKFDAFQLSNKTWLIGVMVTVLASMVFIVGSRFLT